MRFASKTLLAAAVSLAVAASAFAQMMPGAGERLDAEVAGFPPYLEAAIKDYSSRLIASVDKFSKMDVSNCHFTSDTTAMIMQNQRDTMDEAMFLEWVVRSRWLGYLSLAKFEDGSKPLVGSYAEKAEGEGFSSEEIIALLPAENTRCAELLMQHAGPVMSQAEDNHGSQN